jgi:hypothetical protein
MTGKQEWDALMRGGLACCHDVKQDAFVEHQVSVVPSERVFASYGDPWGYLPSEEAVTTDLKLSPRGGNEQGGMRRQRFILAVRDDDAPRALGCVADGANTEDVADALRVASHRGALTVVRELLALGVKCNIGCHRRGLLPIHLATAAGHHQVCELLLDSAADARAMNLAGESAQSMSSRCGHEEIVTAIARNVDDQLLLQDRDTGAGYRSIGPQYTLIPRAPQYLAEAILDALSNESFGENFGSVHCGPRRGQVLPVEDDSEESLSSIDGCSEEI